MKYEYDGPRTSVTVTRRFAASPERVFNAWIEPETAGRWLFNTKTSRTECVLDPRVGGAYTITRRRAGKEYVAVGEYREVDSPRRLVFTFAMPQYAADVDVVSVEIAPDGDGCTLTLVHGEMRPGYETSTVKGWEKMFDLLTQVLG